MKDSNKLVSVIIPNYNHSLFLKERIDSILNQDYQPLEIIILDDASTDDSIHIIKEYEPNIKHLIINEVNSGNTFVQWNKGIQYASGEYIWIAESDDSCDKKFLSTLVKKLDENKDCSVVFSNSYMIDDKSKVYGDLNWWVEDLNFEIHSNTEHLGINFIRDFLSVRNVIMNASSAVFRKVYYNSNVIDNINYVLCGDWFTWVKLAEQGNVYFVSDKLNYYRFHFNTVRERSDRKRHIFLESLKLRTYCYTKFDIDNTHKTLIFQETYNNIVNISASNKLVFRYIDFIKQLYLIFKFDLRFFAGLIGFLFGKLNGVKGL